MQLHVIMVPGGYHLVDSNGKLHVEQPFDPEKPFIAGVPQPFDSEAAAAAHAEAVLSAFQPAE